MAVLIVTAPARADSDDIHHRLALEAGIRVADKFVGQFEAFFEQLTVHPDTGAPRPRLGRNVRMGVVRPYLLFYEHHPQRGEVLVLRILHGRRRITRRMLKP